MSCERTRFCEICGKEFAFNEDKTIYETVCDPCAKAQYPLAYLVRSKLNEWEGVDSAREAFTEKYEGSLPDSMIGDDVSQSIASLFKAIGYGVVESIPELAAQNDCIVLVQPSCENSTHFVIIQHAWDWEKNRLLFHDYHKAWYLHYATEDEFEDMLEAIKHQVEKRLENNKLIDAAVDALEHATVQRLSSNEEGEK